LRTKNIFITNIKKFDFLTDQKIKNRKPLDKKLIAGLAKKMELHMLNRNKGVTIG
jgi:hypothetical protein